MTTPVCAACGNDGTKGALYVTVDARWMPELGVWRLVERDDSGGRVLDCLACDHQTPEPAFPYETELKA